MTRAELQNAVAHLPATTGKESFAYMDAVQAILTESKEKLVVVMKEEVEVPPMPDVVRAAIESKLEGADYHTAKLLKPLLDETPATGSD